MGCMALAYIFLFILFCVLLSFWFPEIPLGFIDCLFGTNYSWDAAFGS